MANIVGSITTSSSTGAYYNASDIVNKKSGWLLTRPSDYGIDSNTKMANVVGSITASPCSGTNYNQGDFVIKTNGR